MKISWNKGQEKAITSRNADLLVSAAAGSGKTAVLVERVKQIILGTKPGDEKVDIDRILVVTFTKAAASEMKLKIVKAVEAELEAESPDGQFLRRQLDRIGDADISTFHSFAFRIIRRYFQLVDVEPDFKVMEEGEAVVMKADAADRLFEEYFESGDKEFIDFLHCYSSDRNDRNIKDAIVKLYDKIMATPEPFNWLRDNVAALDIDRDGFEKSEYMRLMKEDVERLLDNAAGCYRKGIDMIENSGLEKMAAKAEEEAAPVFAAKEKFGKAGWDEISQILDGCETVNMRAPNDEKDEWNLIKDLYGEFRKGAKDSISDIKKKYMTLPLDEMTEDISLTYPKAVELEKILKRFHEIYREMKAEQNVLDYSDAEHYALEILENEKVRNEYKEKFKYVFVDEYQDCNVVQDTLLERVSSPGNLFMVGDVKQSIYKFRLAEPELFKTKYSEFAADESVLKEKIDLNMNYRSKANIIDAVNAVFKRSMEDYDDNAALHRGDTYEGEYQPETELHLVQSIGKDAEGLPPDLAKMKDDELEACAVADIINKYVGTPFHDSQEETDRNLAFRDIVILRRSVKGVSDSWQQIFSRQGIPLYSSDSNGYFDTVEVMVFLDFLRLIDNSRRDVPLLSTMRSVIGGFTIDEMIKVRLHTRKGAFHAAFSSYCESGGDEALRKKCAAFAEKMEGYREMARVIPLSDLIWYLMEDTGYFTYAGGLAAGIQRQANLRALIDKASAYQNTGGGNIYGFLRYIEAIEAKDIEVPQATVLGEQDDVVRMMTIHKSKGLEYPMVIVSGLGKGRGGGRGKEKRGVYIHKDVGIGMTRVEYDQLWFRKNLVQTLIENREKKEEDEEDIRVLYVAMTRAKDRLVLTGTVKDIEKEEDRYDAFEFIPDCKTFLDVIGPACDEAGIKIHHFTKENLMKTNAKAGELAAAVDEMMAEGAGTSGGSGRTPAELRDMIDSRLSYEYEYGKDCKVKSKYSVTELNRTNAGEAFEEKTVLNIPAFAAEDGYEEAASRGTAMHTAMEHLDFAEAYDSIQSEKGMEYLDKFIEEMMDRGIISAEQESLISKDNILKFFDTELGRRAAEASKAKRLRKEAPFNVMSRVDGVEVMVQGVIDCYFEEDDGLVLFDYKTNYIDRRDPNRSIEKIKDIYRGQLELYKDALEQITGKKVKEVYLHLFSAGESVKI